MGRQLLVKFHKLTKNGVELLGEIKHDGNDYTLLPDSEVMRRILAEDLVIQLKGKKAVIPNSDPERFMTNLYRFYNGSYLRAEPAASFQEKKTYNPDQPRVPAGSPGGGQFAGGTVARIDSEVSIPPELNSDERKKLETTPESDTKRLNAGANKSYVVTLEDGTKGIFKPKNGENQGLNPAVEGRYYMREAAAADIAKIIGLDDLVPTTVVREVGSMGVGSFQKFVDHAEDAAELDGAARYDGDVDLARAAAFDYLIGQGDRHTGNWMVKDGTKLALIDNGLAFPNNDDTLYTSLMLSQAYKKKFDIPEEIKAWLDKGPAIKDYLEKNGFKQEEIDLTMKRLAALKEEKGFPELYNRAGGLRWLFD